VKAEGNFILRYRCFDLFSRVANSEGQTPVWAECYGGPFRVYSTKEFPGLRASTDLTKVRHFTFFYLGTSLIPVVLSIMHMCGDKKNSTCHTLASASICVRQSARDEKKLMTQRVCLPSVLVLAVPVLERPRASGKTTGGVGTRINVLQGSHAIYSSSRGLALRFHMDSICYESTHNGNTTRKKNA
jgi:hypothetical protein